MIKKKDELIWIAATSEEKGFDKTITNQAKDFLIDSAKKMHNDIDQFPFHSQTACLRPQVEDDLPIIQKISNSVYVASGGGGWGIMMSILVGEIIENEINS